MKKTLLLLSALALAGCTVTRIETPDGAKFSSTRFADFTRIGKIEANFQTNSLTVEGYDSDRQTAAVEAIRLASEAVKAMSAAP